MKPVFLSSARKVVNARSYRILLSPQSFSTCALRDSQSRQVHRMGGRNISTRVEDRGGVRVEINAKTGRGVGVRQISKNCWEARRPNPMKKGGWLKISSHVGADAQAQAELAAAIDRQHRARTTEVTPQPEGESARPRPIPALCPAL